MTPLALVLVIVAGAFHVVWNYLAKSSEDKIAFLWIINGVFCVTYPPAFSPLGASPAPPGRGPLPPPPPQGPLRGGDDHNIL